MENNTVEKFINGRNIQVAIAEDPEDCLFTTVEDLEASYKIIMEKYDADMDAHFATTFADPDFPEKAENFLDSQKRAINLARNIQLVDPEDEKRKDRAIDLINRVIRDAQLLMHNADAYYKRLVRKNCEEHKLLKAADAFSRKTMDHWLRADSTQRRMQKIFYGGVKRGVPIEIWGIVKIDKERYDDCVPAGRIYLPPWPYPPKPIPPDQPVPMWPKPFLAYKAIPPEELEYDKEHDEFIIPEGYVSEDGSMDHNSVRFNWEKMEVTFQFVGGEPVTWKFWKAKDLRDDMEGWGDNYIVRMLEQLLALINKDPYGPQMLDEKNLPYNKKFQ